MKIMQAQHTLADLCAAFAVSRYGYHAWKTRPPSGRQRADATLSQSLCQAHAASRQTYGSPRLLAALRQLMRQQQLRGILPRRFVP